MYRTILILLIFCIATAGFSQIAEFKKPDYTMMRKQIFDSNSPYFYPNLFDRYQNGDTALTVEDFRYLYYGYTLQSAYVPYKESEYSGKMLFYMKKGALSSAELDEFIKLAELNLKDLPFDIRTLHILAYSYSKKDDSLMYSITKFKKDMIIKAILSSGNGNSEQTAFHVIDVAHEYDIINEVGLRFAANSELSNPMCDYLIVQPNEKNIRGLYFDIGRILRVKAERQN